MKYWPMSELKEMLVTAIAFSSFLSAAFSYGVICEKFIVYFCNDILVPPHSFSNLKNMEKSK
nr:MAG TPA: hypothetical protein [Caudoviricetes sp.]